MKAEHYCKLARAAAGFAALTLLAGCANGPGWGAWSQRPTEEEVAVVLARVESQQAIAQQQEARKLEEPPTPSVVVTFTGPAER